MAKDPGLSYHAARLSKRIYLCRGSKLYIMRTHDMSGVVVNSRSGQIAFGLAVQIYALGSDALRSRASSTSVTFPPCLTIGGPT